MLPSWSVKKELIHTQASIIKRRTGRTDPHPFGTRDRVIVSSIEATVLARVACDAALVRSSTDRHAEDVEEKQTEKKKRKAERALLTERERGSGGVEGCSSV